ncbi:MAG: GNAT family N-acetyltransferase [Algicola sp.]|nr:GNAT family N-acetyltransferase [Algicola sp.]
MDFENQPTLKGDLLELRPLLAEDFDALYTVAKDPLIWALHPVKNRHEKTQFELFFADALTSSALVVIDTSDGKVIGSSRFHGYDKGDDVVEIGWSFLARSHWGGSYNAQMKQLMLQHAFKFVERVVLLVGVENARSKRAVEKIGGVYVGIRLDAGGNDSLIFEICRDNKTNKK